MKITAGLGSVDEYVRYVQAGANEFFCGYVPYEWNKRYGTVLPLNRREVLGVNVQIGSESELRILAAVTRQTIQCPRFDEVLHHALVHSLFGHAGEEIFQIAVFTVGFPLLHHRINQAFTHTL